MLSKAFPFVLGLVLATAFSAPARPQPQPAAFTDRDRQELRTTFALLAEQYRDKGSRDGSTAFRMAWWTLTRPHDPPSGVASCPPYEPAAKTWLQKSLEVSPIDPAN